MTTDPKLLGTLLGGLFGELLGGLLGGSLGGLLGGSLGGLLGGLLGVLLRVLLEHAAVPPQGQPPPSSIHAVPGLQLCGSYQAGKPLQGQQGHSTRYDRMQFSHSPTATLKMPIYCQNHGGVCRKHVR